MKIPFDIKYRPRIESGEYKVVTRDGLPVRVLCYDAEGNFPVVAMVNSFPAAMYTAGGCAMNNEGHGKYDLFLVTPEPELNEFEKAIKDLVLAIDEGELQELGVFEEENLGAWAVKKARELFEMAKDEIYSHESLVEYAKTAKAEGKTEALKGLPRWKKADRDLDAGTIDFAVFHRNDGGDHEDWFSVEVTNRLYKGEYYIELSNLEKLPKEKEK